MWLREDDDDEEEEKFELIVVTWQSAHFPWPETIPPSYIPIVQTPYSQRIHFHHRHWSLEILVFFLGTSRQKLTLSSPRLGGISILEQNMIKILRLSKQTFCNILGFLSSFQCWKLQEWKWRSGEDWSFSNWAEGEPGEPAWRWQWWWCNFSDRTHHSECGDYNDNWANLFDPEQVGNNLSKPLVIKFVLRSESPWRWWRQRLLCLYASARRCEPSWCLSKLTKQDHK